MWLLWVLIFVYFLSYTLLFIFPWLAHKPKGHMVSQRLLQNNKVSIIAHRGGLLENYENSLRAFVHAASTGAQGLELDVHTTKDGMLVVCHDDDLTRLTGQNVLVQDICYEEIQEYLPEIHPGYYDTAFVRENKEHEKPPLLNDVFRNLKNHGDLFFNVDIKTNKNEDIVRVAQLIKLYDLEDRVVIGCFTNNQTKRVLKDQGLDLPAYFSVNQVILFFFGCLFGVLPFLPFEHDVLEITGPFETIVGRELLENSWKVRFVYKFLRGAKWILRLWNWHMNRRGIPIIYWTLNTEKDFEHALAMSCNGIMTDRVSVLKRFLMEKSVRLN